MSSEIQQLPAKPGFDGLRRAMVDNQLRPFGITDRALMDCMQAVPRELFVPLEQIAIAYSDGSIMVTAGGISRRMIPPMILARMIQAAAVNPGDHVLDIGGAAGYSAAILAGLGGEVIALEADEGMAQSAAANFKRAGIATATAISGPLESGRPADAPFDVILVNGMIDEPPENLLAQLADGGRLIAIKRPAHDSGGRAGKAVQFEKNGQTIGMKYLFDATAGVLPGFQAAPAFAF